MFSYLIEKQNGHFLIFRVHYVGKYPVTDMETTDSSTMLPTILYYKEIEAVLCQEKKSLKRFPN